MRVLFFKEAFAWPRASGHDIHAYYLARALARLGHEVGLLTLKEPSPEAIEGLPLAMHRCLGSEKPAANGFHASRLGRLQERFRSYWGIEPAHIRAVGQAAAEFKADAVVVVGLSVLPYLVEVEGAVRIWYAADEWVWHHLSQLRLLDRSSWGNLKEAAVKGLYEFAYGPLLDRVWVVSEGDRRAMRLVARAGAVDTITYGVDGERYHPIDLPQAPRSCVFWGRLDFGPNIQALEWFCGRVWPEVRRAAADATFSIYGFHPTAPVVALAGRDGIALVGDLPDLRPEVARHQVVVLPFVSGGGVKNKLLEAASMGKAIVCSRRAWGGLRTVGETPLVTAHRLGDWVRELLALWSDDERRDRLGRDARRWVVEQHSWDAAARAALAGIESSLERRRRA